MSFIETHCEKIINLSDYDFYDVNLMYVPNV